MARDEPVVGPTPCTNEGTTAVPLHSGASRVAEVCLPNGDNGDRCAYFAMDVDFFFFGSSRTLLFSLFLLGFCPSTSVS